MTRRLGAAFAAVLAIALAGAVATASATSGGSPNENYVVGGGENNPANGRINHFYISAHSGPHGRNPWGEGGFIETLFSPSIRHFYGRVICLSVDHNLASLVFEVDNGLNEPSWLAGDVMFLEDDGEPGPSGQSPDRMINSELNATDLASYEENGCPQPKTISAARRLTSGNFVVNDMSVSHSAIHRSAHVAR
jgi:hypothetical protein